jgi:hypothetical protein
MPICEVRGLLKRKFCGCYQSLDGTLEEGDLTPGQTLLRPAEIESCRKDLAVVFSARVIPTYYI